MISSEKYKLVSSPFTIFDSIGSAIKWVDDNKVSGEVIELQKIIVITKD